MKRSRADEDLKVDVATQRGLGDALRIARDEHAPLTTQQPEQTP